MSCLIDNKYLAILHGNLACKKDFFDSDADILVYVCCVYSPRNSTNNANCANHNDLFEQINEDMSQHSKHVKNECENLPQ